LRQGQIPTDIGAKIDFLSLFGLLKELVQDSEFIPVACQLILSKRPVAELHSLAPGVCGDRAAELAEEDSKLGAELGSAAIKTKQK